MFFVLRIAATLVRSLRLARGRDGVRFELHSQEPVFSFGDDIHSVVFGSEKETGRTQLIS